MTNIKYENYIIINNKKFKIYNYHYNSKTNHSILKYKFNFDLWYVSNEHKLKYFNIYKFYDDKLYDDEIAQLFFNKIIDEAQKSKDISGTNNLQYNYFPKKNILEFNEDKNMIFKYAIKGTGMWHISKNISVPVPYGYKKFIPKIQSLILLFKKTEQYKIYIEKVKQKFIEIIRNEIGNVGNSNTIINSCGIEFKQQMDNYYKDYIMDEDDKNRFLEEVYKYITKKTNSSKEWCIVTLYYGKEPCKTLKKIMKKSNIKELLLPLFTYFHLDFDSYKKPSFSKFVFGNNLEITLIDFLTF